MHRTDADGNVNGMFSDGNAEQGALATVIDAKWLNGVQEEIAYFIESCGLELDDEDQHQLKSALLAMFAAGVTFGSVTVTGAGSEFSSLTAKKLTLNGVSIEQTVQSNVSVIQISHTLECLARLVVQGNAYLHGALSVDGALDANGGVSGNLTGNVTGNVTGTHFGNVHSDEILPMTNGGNVGITRPNVIGKATFQNETVHPKILLSSSGYSSVLLDNATYTAMSEGSVVYAINGYDGLAGIQVSSTKYIVVKPGTGVALIKASSGTWYPLSPDADLGSI